MRTAALAPLAVLVTLCSLLTGCAHIEVALGRRVYLEKLPVITMQVALPKNPAIAPGERSRMVATFTTADGTTWVTEGKGKGKILWKDIAVTTSVVTAKKGTLSLAADPRASDGQTGHVGLTVPSHPALHAELTVPLRYDYPFSANFSGSDGSNGSNGTDGSDGSAGSAGSTDPDSPTPGGNGGNGSSGADGGNGGDGSNAPPALVRITLRPGVHPLLQCSVSSDSRDQFFLVDPQGGTLTIHSEGGRGGSGGKGGRGGRGGSGGIGSPSGSNGSDGLDGHDGISGSDGRAGSITVLYDPSAQPYLSTLHFSNPGGPSPVLTEAPVAAIW